MENNYYENERPEQEMNSGNENTAGGYSNSSAGEAYDPGRYNPYSTGSTNSGNGSSQYTYGYGPQYNQNPKPRKKKKSFAKTLGKTAAIALVFGLVSGAVFTGVSQVGSSLLGSKNSRTEVQSEEADASADSTTKSAADYDTTGTVDKTETGNATELTDVSAIVESVMPSIVAITNTSTVTYQSFWGQAQSYDATSCGSGIIIDQDDEYLYVATNNHVVSGANALTVQFSNDVTVDAETRGTYSTKDLAVVQVKLSDIDSETLSTIKVATVGDSSALKVGEASIAIGNALGYGQSVTTGIISAKGRSITVSDSTTGSTTTNSNLLQTDAAINPGNSGGALLNSKGEVIGINSAKYSDTDVEGVGYAIPMEDAMPIIQSLIESGSYVNEKTPYLGIGGADVTSSYAQMYNMPEGVYILEVYEGSGAETAKLQEGDIITEVDGTTVTCMDDLKAALASYEAGDVVKLTVYRQQGKGYQAFYASVELKSASEINMQTEE